MKRFVSHLALLVVAGVLVLIANAIGLSQPRVRAAFIHEIDDPQSIAMRHHISDDMFTHDEHQGTLVASGDVLSPPSQVYVVDTAIVHTIMAGTQRHTYTYNGRGLMTSALVEITENEWSVNSVRVTYIYGGGEQLLTSVHEYWMNGQWVNDVRNAYTYNAGGHVLTDLRERWTNEQWVNDLRNTYTYDTSGHVLTTLQEYWTNGQWVSSMRKTYTCNAGGQVASKLDERWTGSHWVNYAQHTYGYDGGGHVLTDVCQMWTNGQWVNTFRNTYIYDDKGNLLHDRYEDWTNGEWRPWSVATYTCDGNGNVVAYDFRVLVGPHAYDGALAVVDSAGNSHTYTGYAVNLKWKLCTIERWNEIGVYPSSTFHHTAGRGTPQLKLQVIDSTRITGHTYELTFLTGIARASTDTVRSLSLYDMSAGIQVLNAYPIVQGESTPIFDGLRLTVVDTPIGIDSLRSGWQTSTATNLVDVVGRPQALPSAPFVPAPLDLELRWNWADTTASGKWLYPGDTLLNNQGRRVVTCPFKVVNVTDTTSVRVLIDRALVDSIWRPGREIVVLTPPTYHPSPPIATMVGISFLPPPSGALTLPGVGDVYLVASTKPLSTEDVFRFTADRQYVLGVKPDVQPLTPTLFQNYPNPFNPSTTIRYGLPSRSRVTLTIFNTLGQKVATLVEGEEEAGFHAVNVDMSHLASGVYLYRLTAGDFVQTLKLILLK